MYRHFDLKDIPSDKRAYALQLKLTQWTPFPQSAYYIAWHQAQAQVWLWDKAEQKTQQQAVELNNANVLPESVLRPAQIDGCQVQKSIEGFEGQCWRKGCLYASHWWAEQPSASVWQRFVRSHGGAPIVTAPPIVISDFLAKPWAKNKQLSGGGSQIEERLIVLMGAAILMALLAWKGVETLKWQFALDNLDSDINALKPQTAPILKARADALERQLLMQQLTDLKPYPIHIEIMDQVTKNVDKAVEFLEWTYQSGDLSFKVQADNIDPRAYVNTFQASPYFKEVQTKTGYTNTELVISLRLEKSSRVIEQKAAAKEADKGQ